MVVSDNEELLKKAKHLTTQAKSDELYYTHDEIGYNYRMTELQGALGVSQMQRLDQFVEQRQLLQKRYHDLLQGLPLVVPHQFKDSYSALHLYPIQIKLDEIDKTHAEVFEALREAGLGVNVHYIPVHTQPYYQNMGSKAGDYPNAEFYYSRAISIPLYHGMTLNQQDEVVAILKQVLQ